MAKTNNDYYVFEGQKATAGTPNRITGRMSYFGNMLKFRTKKESINYVAEYRGFGICKAGTENTLRKYNLGCSVKQYKEDLYFISYQ